MTQMVRNFPEVLLEVGNISLAFGGVHALTEVSFDIRKGEIRAIIGPNGAGKTSMLNVINGFYHPQQGTITYKGEVRQAMRPHHAAKQGIARTFQNVALFKGMSTLDNIMTGRNLVMNRNLFWQARGHYRFSGNSGHPQNAGRPPALWSAEACRTGPRAGYGAGSAAARRTDGRHECRGKGRHVPLRAGRERRVRHHDCADRT
jgi:ABC-type sugar transport system ATPase subunit